MPRWVLALDCFEGFVNTPSGFLERRWCCWALINESAACGLLLFPHSAVNRTPQMASGLVTLFNRRVPGAVTQVDRPDANVRRARTLLANAGLKDSIEVSAVTGQGMDTLRAAIDGAASSCPRRGCKESPGRLSSAGMVPIPAWSWEMAGLL